MNARVKLRNAAIIVAASAIATMIIAAVLHKRSIKSMQPISVVNARPQAVKTRAPLSFTVEQLIETGAGETAHPGNRPIWLTGFVAVTEKKDRGAVVAMSATKGGESPWVNCMITMEHSASVDALQKGQLLTVQSANAYLHGDYVIMDDCVVIDQGDAEPLVRDGQLASGSLSAARQLLTESKLPPAKTALQLLIRQYPDSLAAIEAATLLEHMAN